MHDPVANVRLSRRRYPRVGEALIRERLRRVVGAARQQLIGRNLALNSSSATLYGALALGPALIVAVSLAQGVLGRDRVAGFGADLAVALPEGMGSRGLNRLIEAGLGAGWEVVFFAAAAGSAYGAGLRAAMRAFGPSREGTKIPTWWARVLTLPLLALAPILFAGLLLLGPSLSDLTSAAGPAGVALASWLSLTIIWLLTWAPLTWIYRVVGPGRPAWPSALFGAVVGGAFLSGFLQGFLLFVALPVDLGRPFGGLTEVGVVISLLLWLWVFHFVLIAGYALTWGWELTREQAKG